MWSLASTATRLSSSSTTASTSSSHAPTSPMSFSNDARNSASSRRAGSCSAYPVRSPNGSRLSRSRGRPSSCSSIEREERIHSSLGRIHGNDRAHLRTPRRDPTRDRARRRARPPPHARCDRSRPGRSLPRPDGIGPTRDATSPNARRAHLVELRPVVGRGGGLLARAVGVRGELHGAARRGGRGSRRGDRLSARGQVARRGRGRRPPPPAGDGSPLRRRQTRGVGGGRSGPRPSLRGVRCARGARSRGDARRESGRRTPRVRDVGA